jgi:hypothetical protein
VERGVRERHVLHLDEAVVSHDAEVRQVAPSRLVEDVEEAPEEAVRVLEGPRSRPNFPQLRYPPGISHE